jgi:outer membrane receptor protein involved in Fe transport
MKAQLLCGIAVCGLTAVGRTAFAADAVDGAPTQVGEVVVTATRDARALREVPASVSVVTATEIQQTPAKSLDDILRRVPSVDVPISASYQIHPTADNVSMRGLGGIRALVLLDGVPLNDPFFGYVQWSRVPLETIDRVEIVRGGGATLWGNYAMGGVINVISKPPTETELVLQGGAGSYGTYRANGYGALVASDAVRLGLDFGWNHTDGFQTAPKDQRVPIDVPTAFTAYNGALTGAFNLSPNLQAHARIGYFDDHQTLGSRLSTNKQRTWTYSADATENLGAAGELTLTAFHDDSRFQTDNTDTPSNAAFGTAEFVQNRHFTPVHDTGASLIWSKTLTGWLHSVSVGADYHGISGSDTADIFIDTGQQIRTDVGRGRQQFLGVFAQASIKPIDALEILASARYQDFKNYDAFDGSPGGLGHVPDQRASSFDPRVSVRYAVNDDFALRAAAYKAFRAPTLDNLYRAFATPSGIFFGNPALQPETLEGGEVGFDFNHGPLRTQVTAYTNTIKNLITFANLPDSQLPPGFFFGTRNINAGEARSRGVEAEVNWLAGRGWTLNAGYTYADSTITQSVLDPASVGKQQAGIPPHKLSAGVTYEGPGGWRISPQVRWVSKSWGDNDNTLPVDGHFVADLAASYPISRKLELYAQIENLFDTTYIADNSGFEAPRRGTPFTAFVGARFVLD